MRFLEDPTRHPNNTSGESYVVDQNGDGVINSDDYVKIGQATPDFYWGLNSSMSYKAFDLSMQWQGSHGAEVYNIDPLYYESQWSGRLVDTFDANDDGCTAADSLIIFVVVPFSSFCCVEANLSIALK